MVKGFAGPSNVEVQDILSQLGSRSLENFTKEVMPPAIRGDDTATSESSLFSLKNQKKSESEFIHYADRISQLNKKMRSLIGLGYHSTFLPPVIQRNVLENPGWYTAYTPYQAEISQGRLEVLFYFQTMLTNLTGMEICNASLLDESTAATEALSIAWNIAKKKRNVCLVDNHIFSQHKAVIQTRMHALGVNVIFTNLEVLFSNEKSSSDRFLNDRSLSERLISSLGSFTSVSLSHKFCREQGKESELLSKISWKDIFAILRQTPTAQGAIKHLDVSEVCESHKIVPIVGVDLMSLIQEEPPQADIVFGTTQRFGVFPGFGGPHAAFLATKEKYKRLMPGRIVGLSKDKSGCTALRMALQTREQHIRREKATSNVCTAQVLLAVLSTMYAIYHGKEGLQKISQTISQHSKELAQKLLKIGLVPTHNHFFDTLHFSLDSQTISTLRQVALEAGFNFFYPSDTEVQFSLDELTNAKEVETIFNIFKKVFSNKNINGAVFNDRGVAENQENFKDAKNIFDWPSNLKRKIPALDIDIFKKNYSETQMLRYIKKLEDRDLALNRSMIPLGSCTMKLTSAASLQPLSSSFWTEMHPFAPMDQCHGYLLMLGELESFLCELTGFKACSLQPNSGAQGELAGLLAIQSYHERENNFSKNICLIPRSAHGTNPASAVMAGLKVVFVDCDTEGSIDLKDLKTKAMQYKSELSSLMITYPSTHGVFEPSIKEICSVVHKCGGLVYLDGANMNAMVGVVKPSTWGVDVCHLNLHKTFSIPHGGGGPGVGPILVNDRLRDHLPTHPVYDPVQEVNSFISQQRSLVQKNSDYFLKKSVELKPVWKGLRPTISATPWGSASILTIAWGYILMLGREGHKKSTELAIMNANYIAHKLRPRYTILYTGQGGWVAHECIVDFREFKEKGIHIEDVAKRLMDFGFHAPTMAWPVEGTLMIEPTESENKEEIDRFCEAMLTIRDEIDHCPEVLKNAPHTLQMVVKDEWDYPYSREKAVFPLGWIREHKFWPSVSRIDQAYGDKNLVCACPSIEDYFD